MLACVCTHTHTPGPVPNLHKEPFLEQSEIPCIPFKELISCPIIALMELTCAVLL